MQYTLTRSQVHRHAASLLQTHLRLTDFRSRCPARLLLDVLLAAAAWLTSLSAACLRLLRAPCPETARLALHHWLPAQDELERRLNAALADRLPRGLRRRRQRLAIDLTLVPYHGLPFASAAEVYRSKARDGTSHFHAYATAYLLLRGQRFTLALTPVARGEHLEDVLRRLLRRCGRLGIRPRLLLLDRGFYSAGVIRYLQAARYAFLMPLPLRGRKADHPDGPGGSNVFRYRARSGWDRYTLRSADGRTATVSVCVKCRNWRGERGRHGRQRLVYAFWGFTPASWDWVRQAYRSRFAIETSYRQLQQGRARTSSRHPSVRLLLVGLALVLRNVWVWLHHAVLSVPRRGGRVLRLERLRLRTMLTWLLHVVLQRYDACDQTRTERPIGLGFGF
jgi:Transposase DDE domain